MEQDNQMNEFNEGGTHEQNPNGGVPQGTGDNGKQNTVEEGETKVKIGEDDYIFSARISTKEKYVGMFNLPTYVKGKTFSDASKAISKRFKDKNDNASNSTKNTLYERLSRAQERSKLEKLASDADMSVEEYVAAEAAKKAEADMQEAEQAAQQAQEQVGAAPGSPVGQEQALDAQIQEQGMQPSMEPGQEQFGFGGGMTGGTYNSDDANTAMDKMAYGGKMGQ